MPLTCKSHLSYWMRLRPLPQFWVKFESRLTFCNYWFFVNFIPCTPIPFISLFHHTHSLSLQPALPSPQTNQTKPLSNCISCSVSHSIPFCPHFFACKCSLQWVIGLVWGLWLLLHYQYWILIRTPLGVALYHGDPAPLVLQDCPITYFSSS